jgi:hypothetical protein
LAYGEKHGKRILIFIFPSLISIRISKNLTW